MNRLLKQSWVVLFVSGLIFIFFWDSFLDGKTLFLRDTFCDNYPMRLFTKQAFLEGALPFWNPYSLFGQPFAAEPLTAVFYPIQFLFFVFPSGLALKLSWVLHLLIGALSMYRLGRSWELDIPPALILSITFSFGTFVISYLEFPTFFNTIVWTPLSLVFFNSLTTVWIKRKRDSVSGLYIHSIPAIIALSLCLSMQFLAGHPQAFLFSCLLLIAYAVGRVAIMAQFRQVLGCFSCLIISCVLALGLVMYQIFLTIELIPYSIRSSGIDPGINVASVHPRQLLMLISPFLFGRPGYPDQWAEGTVFEYWGASFYIGIIPLILSSFSPMKFFHNRFRDRTNIHRYLFIFFASICLFGFTMASGKHAGIYSLFYEYIPFFERFRQPSKFLFYAAFSLPVLAAIGFQRIIELRRHPPEIRMLPFFVMWLAWMILFIMFTVCSLYAARDPASFAEWITDGLWSPKDIPRLSSLLADFQIAVGLIGMGLLTVGALIFIGRNRKWVLCLVVFLTFGNLFYISRQIHPITEEGIYDCRVYRPNWKITPSPEFRIHSIYSRAQQSLYACKDSATLRWACGALIGETGLPQRWFKTNGGGGLPLKGLHWLINSIDDFAPETRERILDMLSIRYVVSGRSADDILWRRAPKAIYWLERPTWSPRAIVVNRIHSAEDWQHALSQIVTPGFNPSREAVVELAPIELRKLLDRFIKREGATNSSGRLDLIRYKWNQINLEMDVAQGGLLVLNEAWYPGWKVTVNGVSQPLLRVNGIFQGVWVDPGKKSVQFLYTPRFFKLGIAIALSVVLLMVGLAWYWAKSIRRNAVKEQCK